MTEAPAVSGWIILAVLILGAAVLVGLAVLYIRSFPHFFHRHDPDFYDFVRHLWNITPGDVRRRDRSFNWDKIITMVNDDYTELLARREAFWTFSVQSAISLIVVLFVVILLLLKIVSAEAGLPILAAFGGAAIGQGVSSGKTALKTRNDAWPTPPPPEEGEGRER